MKFTINRFLWLLKLPLLVSVLLLGMAILYTLFVPDVSCPGEMGYIFNGRCVYE